MVMVSVLSRMFSVARDINLSKNISFKNKKKGDITDSSN